jgi:hypothetical protein
VTSTYSISNSTTSAILATGTGSGATSLTSAAATTSKTLPADSMGAAPKMGGNGLMVGGVVVVMGMMLL